MYVKFQYVDTSNCFHILNSTKPTPSIGISIPPTKKYKNQNKLNDPNGRIEKSKNLGVKFRPGVGYGNDVKEKLDYQIGKNSHTRVWKNGVLKTQNGFLRKPVDEIESEEKIDGQSSWSNGVQTKCSTKWRNDVKETQNGFLRKPVDRTESEEKIHGKLSSGNVLQTNCSTKWCNDVKETQNGVFRKPVDRTENKKKLVVN
ncbi:hypothetical protein H5410_048435 [Solanum commersonii]|uniref:Uncharacterized protein n=1 Tax=Solanum commersonii TaxID=4109 RepID=A0A9J5XI27_SOLCO|nr:hypothetical protein H5410_048435 [Solanum commersonii]